MTDQTADVIAFRRNPRTEKPEPSPRTRQEIEDLKDSWLHDDTWDVENTEGFEAHRDELHLFRKKIEAQRRQSYEDRIDAVAVEIGCPGNFSLAEVVYHMRQRIGMLECDLEEMEARR